MSDLLIGDKVFVQSYKHDGSIHRTWSKGFVVDENDDYYVVVTDHSWVVEADRRRWLTKEPAICFLYKKRWFNVISMIRKSGIYYYCNIATPSIYDGEAIKNVDYDLDVKVFPDYTYAILDKNEYEYHCQKMNYSEQIKNICEKEMNSLILMIENKEKPFNSSFIQDYIVKYFSLIYDEHKSENVK